MSHDGVVAHGYEDHLARGLRDLLPIVLHQVLRHHGTTDLVSALQVCRAWAAAGIPLRWRSVHVRFLEHIADYARRQLYANEIQHLEVSRYWDRHDEPYFLRKSYIEGLRFGRLRRVTVSEEDWPLGADGICPFPPAAARGARVFGAASAGPSGTEASGDAVPAAADAGTVAPWLPPRR